MRLRLALVAFALIGLSEASHAAMDVELRQYLTGFRKVATNVYERIPVNSAGTVAGSGTRAWAMAGTDIVVTDAVVVGGPAGDLAVTAASRVGVANAARAIATAALLPEIATAATAAAVVWTAYKVFVEDGSMMQDPGQAKTSQPAYHWFYGDQRSPYATHSGDEVSVSAAVAAWMAAFDKDNTFVQTAGANTTTYTQTSSFVSCNTATNPTCTVGVHRTTTSSPCTGNCTSVSDFQATMSVTKVQANLCPASVDALNPANSIPAGASPYPDGTCPTARYNHQPITADDAAARVVANPAYAPPGSLLDAVKKLVEAGYGTGPDGGVKGIADTTSGPSSQPGTPVTSTTTGPNGTTSTTTTPRYDYSYTPDKITVTPGETTVTTNPDGSTTTTGTSGGQPNSGKVEVPDYCLDFPDRAGCKEVGEPPAQEDIQKDTKSVTFSPEGGFGADNGACPGLVHTQLVGNVDPYGLFCKYMSGIRFAVVGVAWIIAAMIFIGRVET